MNREKTKGRLNKRKIEKQLIEKMIWAIQGKPLPPETPMEKELREGVEKATGGKYTLRPLKREDFL